MEGLDFGMKLEGTMAEIFAKLDTKLYRKYVRTERGDMFSMFDLKNNCMVHYRLHYCVLRKLTKLLVS